jgi:hypothetical protein
VAGPKHHGPFGHAGIRAGRAGAHGLAAGPRLETFALVNGFVAGLVRPELASSAAAMPDPARAGAQAARLGELLATGRYPRFAAAVAQGGAPAAELGAQFERLLDRILDGLVSGAGSG